MTKDSADLIPQNRFQVSEKLVTNFKKTNGQIQHICITDSHQHYTRMVVKYKLSSVRSDLTVWELSQVGN